MTNQETIERVDTLRVCTCHLGTTLCALDTAGVQEVIRIEQPTRIHGAPPYVVGIINLRGRIVTVIDIGVRMGIGVLTLTEDSRVFILEHEGESVGLLVDRVLDIVEIAREQISPPPPNLKGMHAKFVSGVFRTEETLVAILNTEQLLAGDR